MRQLKLAELEQARWTAGRTALLFLTDRCPVGCAHCSVDSRTDSPTITDFARFEQIVDGICGAPTIEIVGISGGEPFVERRGLVFAIEHFVAAGKTVVPYTSGVWATRDEPPAWIRDVIRASSCIFLSTDAFHAEAMADERFVRAARAIANEGVWIVVQVIEMPQMVERAEGLLRAAFGEDYGEAAELKLTSPLPYGRGANVFMRTKHTPGRDFGPCEILAAPVIRYDGLVSACCNENVIMGGGPDRLRRRCGTKGELLETIETFRSDPLLGAIGSVGPGALTAHPRFADLADKPYTSICGLCWELLARTEHDAESDPFIRAVDAVGAAAR